MVRRREKKPTRKLFIEGGGRQNPVMKTEARRAFSKLFERAGIENRPQVIVAGGRAEAYKQFRRAHETGEDAWLLVDAEELPTDGQMAPWSHVGANPQDRWQRPAGVTDAQLHFMSACMETWLLADHRALLQTLGRKLDTSKLPDEGAHLERKTKVAVLAALKRATRDTSAGSYDKGSHSFKALAEVSPAKLRALSWAARFLDVLGTRSR